MKDIQYLLFRMQISRTMVQVIYFVMIFQHILGRTQFMAFPKICYKFIQKYVIIQKSTFDSNRAIVSKTMFCKDPVYSIITLERRYMCLPRKSLLLSTDFKDVLNCIRNPISKNLLDNFTLLCNLQWTRNSRKVCCSLWEQLTLHQPLF